MLDDRQNGLLRDILDSAVAITRYLDGVSKEDFFSNTEKQDAILRRLEIIGEAASHIAPETRALFPNIPFRNMRGMRNIIAHDYGEVNIDQVWETATNDIENLITTLGRHFA